MSVVITMPSLSEPCLAHDRAANALERIHDNDKLTQEALMQIGSLRDDMQALHAQIACAEPRNPLEESAFLAVRTDLRLCDKLLRESADCLRAKRK